MYIFMHQAINLLTFLIALMNAYFVLNSEKRNGFFENEK